MFNCRVPRTIDQQSARSLKKEYVEIYKGESTGIIRDYKKLEVHGLVKPFRKKLMGQDKGQKVSPLQPWG